MAGFLCLDAPPAISATGIARHGESTRVDRYLLPEHWCFHVYGYRATLELDGRPYQISPGDASLIPPGVSMVYRYAGSSEHVYFHLKPCVGERLHELPLTLPLGSRYPSIDKRARAAVIRGRTDHGYSVSVLWNLLWEYADLSTGNLETGSSPYHPSVSTAIQCIEQQLAFPLTVSALCEEVGVSYGYLTRLFSRELGMSVSGYIRHRRAEQALHLLSSTNMPIKAIARSVGVPSLTQFNRLMLTAKGQGPRALRSAHRAGDSMTSVELEADSCK